MPNRDNFPDWLIQASLPFFVRYVPNSGAGGESARTNDECAKIILAEILEPDIDGQISVYRVESYEEIVKVALTLRLLRGGGDIRFYIITPADLAGLPFVLSPTNCTIRCFWTRSRHYDLPLDRGQRETLSQRLAVTRRRASPLVKPNRPAFVDIANQARTDGCYSAVLASTQCTNCDSTGQHVP